MNSSEIAKMIDHAILKPDTTKELLLEGCSLAHEYGVATVCVRPCDVADAVEALKLKHSSVLVSTVIGFPHGGNTTEIKAAEALRSILDGAKELDMVQNIGRLKCEDLEYVEADIRAVANIAHSHQVTLKVILENCYLTYEEKVLACKIAERAGADYVKTSTGYGSSGAAIDDIKLMCTSVSKHVKVKAAGGIRTLAQALAARAAGASRLGTGSTQEIIDAARTDEVNGAISALHPDKLGDGY